jgi:hypothetical protein
MSFLPLAGALEAGVFRTIELENKAPRVSEIRADPRYGQVPQYAWEVRGDSMNLAGIDDGTYIIAAAAEDFRKKLGRIKFHSYVIVQRLREGGREYELSLKQYIMHRRSPGGGGKHDEEAELRPCSTNKAHKSLFIPLGIQDGDTWSAALDTWSALDGEPAESEIQIIGVVLSVVRLLNP